jgi:hypothetical protein
MKAKSKVLTTSIWLDKIGPFTYHICRGDQIVGHGYAAEDGIQVFNYINNLAGFLPMKRSVSVEDRIIAWARQWT